MGDLRNKLNKQARAENHRYWLAIHHPQKPRPQPPRCECGLSVDQNPNMLAYQPPDRWRPTRYLCPACMPFELWDELAQYFVEQEIGQEKP